MMLGPVITGLMVVHLGSLAMLIIKLGNGDFQILDDGRILVFGQMLLLVVWKLRLSIKPYQMSPRVRSFDTLSLGDPLSSYYVTSAKWLEYQFCHWRKDGIICLCRNTVGVIVCVLVTAFGPAIYFLALFRTGRSNLWSVMWSLTPVVFYLVDYFNGEWFIDCRLKEEAKHFWNMFAASTREVPTDASDASISPPNIFGL